MKAEDLLKKYENEIEESKQKNLKDILARGYTDLQMDDYITQFYPEELYLPFELSKKLAAALHERGIPYDQVLPYSMRVDAEFCDNSITQNISELTVLYDNQLVTVKL